MKSFVHSSLWVTSLLLIVNLFLTSCEKDKEDPETASTPLIATAFHYDTNGELIYSESFQYDNQGRLINREDNDGYITTMEYTGSTVTVKDFEDDELKDTSIGQLDTKGLCTSMSFNGEDENITYDYDNNGYRKSFTSEGGSWLHTSAFTVSEGNYVTIITTQSDIEISALAKKITFLKRSTLSTNLQKRISPENRLKSATTTYISKNDFQFYQDKINTIEYENMGISFMGKQNKNPIKQETTTETYNGEVYGPDTITYSYEYDAKGRITKQTSNEGEYVVFTYIE